MSRATYSLTILGGNLVAALATRSILAIIVPMFAPLAGRAGLISVLLVSAAVSLANDIGTWLKSTAEPDQPEQ